MSENKEEILLIQRAFNDCPLVSIEWDGDDTLVTFRVPKTLAVRAGKWNLTAPPGTVEVCDE